MFRYLARRIPRFSFWTLLAAMLLAISFGGAARYGLGPEYGEAAALRALEQEGIGYQALRPSQTSTNSEKLSADAWNPIARIGKWIGGYPDRIGGIDVQAWPSVETRETLFDLPDLEYLAFAPPIDRARTEGPGRIPTPEEILGRPLPEFPAAVDLPAEPPPVPSGDPLSDEERDIAIAEMTKAWTTTPPTFLRQRYLCRAESTEYPGTTRLVASDVDSTWLLWYDQVGAFASATTELRTENVAVDQVWNEGGWRTYSAHRNLTAAHQLADPSIGTAWPTTYVAQATGMWLKREPEKVYESVERLEDGTLALHVKPHELRMLGIPPQIHKLLEGVVIVDPANDFAFQRFEMTNEGFHGSGVRTSFCYLFEYDKIAGQTVPVRTSLWTEFPQHTINGITIPAGPRTVVARYAWEFDPEIPASLFDLPRGKGQFFTSSPSTEVHWWYVTGALSLGWLYFVATNGIRRRFRGRNSHGAPVGAREGVAGTVTNGIAESGGGS